MNDRPKKTSKPGTDTKDDFWPPYIEPGKHLGEEETKKRTKEYEEAVKKKKDKKKKSFFGKTKEALESQTDKKRKRLEELKNLKKGGMVDKYKKGGSVSKKKKKKPRGVGIAKRGW